MLDMLFYWYMSYNEILVFWKEKTLSGAIMQFKWHGHQRFCFFLIMTCVNIVQIRISFFRFANKINLNKVF